MRALVTSVAVAFVLVSLGWAQTPEALRSLENHAFQVGEKLTYRIHYGIVTAGYATLEVKQAAYASRPAYDIVGTGRTTGATDWIFSVRDTYETIMDQASLMPWHFIRRVNEGGYLIHQDVFFDPYRGEAATLSKGQKTTMSIPPYTQDLISAFYYARTLDYGSNPAGTQFDLGQYHLDGEITPISLKYLGRETLSTALGKIQCLKLRPILQEGRVFKESEGMSIWVSDDAAHVPIRVQADILVGSIRMDISEATGLIRPLPQK